MSQDKYVVGLDCGTLSGRAVVFRVSDGKEMGTAVKEYTHAVMDRTLDAGDGQELPPDFALQYTQDYMEVLQQAIPGAVKESGVDPNDIIGIGIDFTSATVIPCKADGTPLDQLEEFKSHPHAFVKLWKHHGAQDQADRLVAAAVERDEWWLSRYGGGLSSELLMPKVLETLEKDREVYDAADFMVDALDWIVWRLTGELSYSAGDSGYKRMYQDGQYPSREYLESVNPDFGDIFEVKMAGPVLPLGAKAGELTEEAAEWTGLPAGIAVATGNIDAHVAAPAMQAVRPGIMTAIMGTSTCWLVSGEELKDVPGMFGVVDGGLAAGLWGFEGGQTAVGDIFAWFVDNCVPGSYYDEAKERGIGIHDLLVEKAEKQVVGEHGLIALDWHNGNRSVLADANLSGMIMGQTLVTTPEDQYRALIEATAFGARMIIETFDECGVEINEVVCGGGLTKNKFLMQIYADVLNMSLSEATAAQPGSLGSACFAAVAAGAYDDIVAASDAMANKVKDAYVPDPERAAAYNELYAIFHELHDHFGRGASKAMYQLKDIRRKAFEKKTAK